MQFRDRDGVCIEYEVRGIPGSEAYPYVDHLLSLKAAVAIAKTYPDVHHDGSATHIVRRYSKKYPAGHKHHHSSGFTHRWRVEANGRIQLLTTYSRAWTTTRLGLNEWIQGLPQARHVPDGVRTQLSDLACIAERIGYAHAAKALRDHAGGRAVLSQHPERTVMNVAPIPLVDEQGKSSVLKRLRGVLGFN